MNRIFKKIILNFYLIFEIKNIRITLKIKNNFKSVFIL